MAEQHHEPGTMDITAQQRVFHGFVKMITRASIVIVVLLILLALVNA
ncbi:aa3-type cytochrome c oxidase subunit IV [Wenxinia saemankumensis]|uniref:Aa3 type cytochrome c oxidase subunit IV n=1 Tax=Wenxinia saemankumensis TaxID=1447782 RepID=A0A1M6E973_9RHOB|nr:aa3-type cytochrome c oxidase subunit IV [Wenxinia saemankumensis]SHI81838.1 aa3 type cytochrome c oxidase subunit IV [Wenxinia saemankumensis]